MSEHSKVRRMMRQRAAIAGFSLLEVIVAAGLLGLGLLSIVRVFPYGLQVAQRAEDVTHASILARTMFEGIKADGRDFPIIPGDPVTLIPLPGNGFDDDGDWTIRFRSGVLGVDLNGNGRPDVDFDGFGEPRLFLGNGVDDDNDGVIDDDGDGLRGNERANTASRPHPGPSLTTFTQPDGNPFYDPEPFLDEEWCNGIDDDKDGFIDEDCHLATTQQAKNLFQYVRASGGRLSQYDSYADIGRRPLLPGDGIDNDHNGELDAKRANDRSDPRDEFVFDEVHDAQIRRANGLDDSGDGRIDEGIDDRIFGARGQGVLLADTQMARFPWSPARFPAPNDRYGWQIFTGPVSDSDVPPELSSILPERYRTGNLGDGIDDDGDGLTDEEILDGQDNDIDGRIDEDCIASPLPGWLKVVIVISWGGDGLNNDASSSNCGAPSTGDEPPDGRGDFPDCAVDPRVNLSQYTANYPENLGVGLRSAGLPDYGHIAWGIDEELQDGIDNDLDGLIDEDTHLYEYRLVGFISLRDHSRSLPLLSVR